jgi:hypothetical protein
MSTEDPGRLASPLTEQLGPLPMPAAETAMDLCADHEGPVEAWQYLPADAMLYTANQMRGYATQEVAAALERAISDLDKLRAALGSIHWRVARSDAAFDDFAAAVLTEVCEQACPELRALGPNVRANLETTHDQA